MVFPRAANSSLEQPEQTTPQPVPKTKEAVQAIAIKAAQKYGINEAQFLKTQSCEIKKYVEDGELVWDYEAQSDYINRKGIRENSWGAWQIHLTAHPEITKEQAQSVEWSTDWAAQQFAQGNKRKWTCWQTYYG